jgi:hypothetical protein
MPMFYVKRWEEAKDVLDKMKPISQAAAKGHPEDKLEKYGKTGKPLLNMPLISRTLPAMHGLPIKQSKEAITLLNIWLRYCQII